MPLGVLGGEKKKCPAEQGYCSPPKTPKYTLGGT